MGWSAYSLGMAPGLIPSTAGKNKTEKRYMMIQQKRFKCKRQKSQKDKRKPGEIILKCGVGKLIISLISKAKTMTIQIV